MQITIREPGSALTHFIAMLLAAFAAAPLLTKAALYAGRESIIALSIFCVSMILLYGASATYHSCLLYTSSEQGLFPETRMPVWGDGIRYGNDRKGCRAGAEHPSGSGTLL